MSKILVVDDAPAVAATCVQALADAGYEARAATSVGVTLYGNGNVRARNSITDGALVAVADMLAGQGWLRLDLFGDAVDAYAGAGVAGAVPLAAAWRRVGFARSSTAALSGWSTVRFQLNGIGATAAFNDIRYRVVTP